MPHPRIKAYNYSRTIVLDESTTFEKISNVYGKRNCSSVVFRQDIFNGSENNSPFGTSGSDSSHSNKQLQDLSYVKSVKRRNPKQRKKCINNSDHCKSNDDSHEKFSLFAETELVIEDTKHRAPLKEVNIKTLKKCALKKTKASQKAKCDNVTLEKTDTAIPDFDSIEKDELIIDFDSPVVQSSSTPKQLTTRMSYSLLKNSLAETNPPQKTDFKNSSNEGISFNEACNISNNNQSKMPVNITFRRPTKVQDSLQDSRGTFMISPGGQSPCLSNSTADTASHVSDSALDDSSDSLHADIELLTHSLLELEGVHCMNSTMNSPAQNLQTISPIRNEHLNMSDISKDLFDDYEVKSGMTLERIEEEDLGVSLEEISEECEEYKTSYAEEESTSEEEPSLLVESENKQSCSSHRSSYSNITSESFSQKLVHSLLDDTVAVSAEEKVLGLCGQDKPVSFYSCIAKRVMSKSIKIGEGVYGEVFRTFIDSQSLAIKIIPIEGDIIVNECPQKKFEEILPEIVIAQELSNLSINEINQTDNFCQVRRISCVKGHFPDILLDKWDDFDSKKKSENDRPDQFPSDQLFIMFEFYDGGCALEKFKFTNPLEIFSTIRQVVFALAVAEECLEFEHRDLHIGNILVKPYQQETVLFKINGCHFMFPTEGVFATIIDFTISRLKKDGCAVFFDVSTDDGLFEGTGDFQFDVYRDMKTENSNDWQRFNPHSNILWINYLCKKLMITLKKGKYGSRSNRDVQKKLQNLLDVVLDYTSCLHLALDDIIWS
ncbi:hypothetical protein Btru_060829 [Bulinus truncatus]|nr:hypothetical protein Btru_060829 [Bulinus truncatus]